MFRGTQSLAPFSLPIRVERKCGSAWVLMGTAPTVEAAERLADAVLGEVRAMKKTKLVGRWLDGERRRA